MDIARSNHFVLMSDAGNPCSDTIEDIADRIGLDPWQLRLQLEEGDVVRLIPGRRHSQVQSTGR